MYIYPKTFSSENIWVIQFFSFFSTPFVCKISRNRDSTKNDFHIKDFFSKCEQTCRKLRIWSHLPKKSLMENFIFCAVHEFEIAHIDKMMTYDHWWHQLYGHTTNVYFPNQKYVFRVEKTETFFNKKKKLSVLCLLYFVFFQKLGFWVCSAKISSSKDVCNIPNWNITIFISFSLFWFCLMSSHLPWKSCICACAETRFIWTNVLWLIKVFNTGYRNHEFKKVVYPQHHTKFKYFLKTKPMVDNFCKFLGIVLELSLRD